MRHCDISLSLLVCTQIYSGQDILTEELIGDYSGNWNSDLPPPLISPTNWVHVKFKSNNYLHYKGFNIAYQVYNPTTDPPTIPPTTKKPGLDPAGMT